MERKLQITHEEMATAMLASVGVTPEGIDLNSKGIVKMTDEFAIENDYHHNGRVYVNDHAVILGGRA